MKEPQANEKSEILPIDSPERRRLPPLLRQAWYGLNQTFRRRIAHTGLTPDQFTLLRSLKENEPKGLTQSDLAQIMSSDPNTISSLVSRVERAGMIRKEALEEDRRARQIRITPQGDAVYQKLRPYAVDLQVEILNVVPEDQRDAFLANLEAVAFACRSKACEAQKSTGYSARKQGS